MQQDTSRVLEEDLEYVGFWPRVLASIVDSILLLVVSIPLIWLFAAESNLELSEETAGMGWFARSESSFNSTSLGSGADLLINWILPALAVILFWLYKSATPGKMMIGAQVVDANTGAPLTPLQAVLRYLGYYVSILPLFLGLVWVALDERKQGWHDKIAGTVVVRRKMRGTRPVSFPSQQDQHKV